MVARSFGRGVCLDWIDAIYRASGAYRLTVHLYNILTDAERRIHKGTDRLDIPVRRCFSCRGFLGEFLATEEHLSL